MSMRFQWAIGSSGRTLMRRWRQRNMPPEERWRDDSRYLRSFPTDTPLTRFLGAGLVRRFRVAIFVPHWFLRLLWRWPFLGRV